MSLDERRPIRAGDLVEIRPASQILATLDADGTVAGIPFMPEMLPYIGRRVRVSKRIEKICWFTPESSSRRLPDTVLLENLRCDGSAHGGCQAECRIYWKDAWLRRVEEDDRYAAPTENEDEALGTLRGLATAHTRTVRSFEGGDEEVFSCQMTEAVHASIPVQVRELGQYVAEIRNRNVGPVRFVRVALRMIWWRVARLFGRTPDMPKLAGAARVDGEKLELEAGDVVEVRSLAEIGRTLDENARHRGLAFSQELAPACGKRFVVKNRVDRLIDERSGRMLEMKNDCIVLEGFVCSGDRTESSLFCPREAYPLFREAWLKHADPSQGG
jgi:hypothetical protein